MDAVNFFERGKQKYARKDYKGAIEDFTESLALKEDADVLSERAVAYYHIRQLRKSLKDLDRAQELQPSNPYRYSSRAYIRDTMGDTSGAIKDYEIAVQLDPFDAVAHNNLGLLQEKLGRKEDAKRLVKQADKLADAQAYLAQERKEKALQKMQLAESGISVQPGVKAETETPPPPASLGDHLSMISRVFQSKETWKEFTQFVRRGFKGEA
ncbi:MAG: tetratricopeptide repeat protein [Salibacteraceae bacterium]